jgi:hypothetical protein
MTIRQKQGKRIEEMNKHILQISKIAVYLMATIATFATNSITQTESPNAQQNDIWELNYMVSVSGDFKVAAELGSGNPDVFYKIDRKYEGKSKLVFSKTTEQRFVFGDSATTQVDIHIDDTRKEIGDPTCDEYLTVDETWKGEMSTLTGNPKFHPFSQLMIDNRKSNYKTSFHIMYQPNPKQYDIDHTKIEIIKTKTDTIKKVTSHPVQHLEFSDYGDLPNVKGYIEENKVIIHTLDWSQLKKREKFTWVSKVANLDTRDRLIWTSAELELHPDEPLIEGVPESKDGVTIFITYALKRVKG